MSDKIECLRSPVLLRWDEAGIFVLLRDDGGEDPYLPNSNTQ